LIRIGAQVFHGSNREELKLLFFIIREIFINIKKIVLRKIINPGVNKFLNKKYHGKKLETCIIFNLKRS